MWLSCPNLQRIILQNNGMAMTDGGRMMLLNKYVNDNNDAPRDLQAHNRTARLECQITRDCDEVQ